MSVSSSINDVWSAKGTAVPPLPYHPTFRCPLWVFTLAYCHLHLQLVLSSETKTQLRDPIESKSVSARCPVSVLLLHAYSLLLLKAK